MKTPTHVVINLLLADRLGWSARRKALFALGGAAPDLPIIAVFSGTALAYGLDMAAAMDAFRTAYASDPLLISAHNLLHAPLSLALLFTASLALAPRFAAALQTFLAGCALHSFIDIYTHVDDGPLMLWPFDWTKRFDGPLSHWDPAHSGLICAAIEIALIAIFIAARIWARIGRGAAAQPFFRRSRISSNSTS